MPLTRPQAPAQAGRDCRVHPEGHSCPRPLAFLPLSEPALLTGKGLVLPWHPGPHRQPQPQPWPRPHLESGVCPAKSLRAAPGQDPSHYTVNTLFSE